jgi:hypothetical protein
MRMDDTAITPNVKCSAGVMSRLMLQPYCDGLRVVRGSGDRCRGGVSACAKPDLDGLPVAQVPDARAAHGGIRSTGGRRYARTPATKDCLECWFTTSFCGFSGAGEVSAYRAIRAGRRIGRHRPARLRVVAAGDDRSPIPSRPVRSSTTPDRRIRSSWERGSTPRLCAFPHRRWVPRRSGLVGHDGRVARQAPSDRSRRRALSCTVLVAGREGDEFGDLRPSKDENP